VKLKLILLFSLYTLVSFSKGGYKHYGNNAKAGHYADINGAKIYYETYGKGTPLLMLHGNGGSIEAFSNQIPFFKKHYKVIAIDSRIQGKSGGSLDTLSYNMMADDFCTLLDQLHIDSACVLGWSDGGNNALIMAMKCPEKIIALSVSGVNVLPDSTALSVEDISGMRNFLDHDSTASLKDKTLTRMMLDQPQIPFAELSKIKCPVLVMGGDHDVIKLEHILKIYQSLPNAQLNIFANSNHGVCQQRPQLFNKTVLDFFTRKP